MINWMEINTTRQEYEAIHAIAKRAVADQNNNPYEKPLDLDFISTTMDIELAHHINPLRLNDLLNANDVNFWHDVIGIIGNLNRSTGQMNETFCPRFSKQQ